MFLTSFSIIQVICILLVSKYSYMYSMTPKYFFYFFAYEHPNYAEFQADFKSHFFQLFRNQREILLCFDIHIQFFLKQIVFRSYQYLFETLKPDSQETAQHIVKTFFYKSVLDLLFTSLYPWTPIIFLKKHHHRCVLQFILATPLS